jgi:PilZ domain
VVTTLIVRVQWPGMPHAEVLRSIRLGEGAPMGQADVKDRRVHPRIVVSWPVRLWNEDEVLVGRAVDASAQGLCIVTAPTEALQRGDSYRVELMVGPSAQVACTGEIRHVTSSQLSSLIGIRTRERMPLV